MRILLTGFEPYLGPLNSTQQLLRSLEAEPPVALEALGVQLALRVLPVDTEAIAGALATALDETRPEALVMLGQAPGRSRVEIELWARNRREFSMPDMAGRMVQGRAVMEGAPERYPTGLPDPRGLAARLEAAGVPAGTSEDAGLYLCNQVFYLACHRAATGDGPRVAGFVHVPVLPEQCRGDGDAPGCLPLAQLRRAAVVLVEALSRR